MSFQFKYLVKRVCGLPTTNKLEGRPLPNSLRTCKPSVVMHDRRISAGIFKAKQRYKNATPRYRLVAWRTYNAGGVERASMTLHRDELETAIGLMTKSLERLSVYE